MLKFGVTSAPTLAPLSLSYRGSPMSKPIISQARLKELLHYNPSTGVFQWNVTRGMARYGQVAGNIGRNGYWFIGVENGFLPAHRLAFFYMTGSYPASDTDHINGIRHDNRWCNLRQVTRQENMRNAKLFKNNTTGETGVYFVKPTGKWNARIYINYSYKNLGTYLTFDEAVAARKKAEKEYGFHENHGRIL